MSLLVLAACAGALGPGGKDDAQDTDSVEGTGGATGPDPFADLPDTGADPDEPDVVVDCARGGDYETIGAAIAASEPGTRIGISPCTYEEDLDFGGKTLDLFGLGDAAAVVIRGSGTVPIVTVKHGESLGTRLAHLTLSGGKAGPSAVIDVDRAALRLDDVVLTDNFAGYALVFAEAGTLDFTDVTITGNTYGTSGTAMYLDNGSMVATRLNVDVPGTNYATYVHNATQLLDSTITTTAPYGLYVDGGELHVRRSRVEAATTAVWGVDLPDTPNERMWLYNSAFVGGGTAVYTQYMHVKADNDVFWGGTVGIDLQLDHLESYVKDSAAIASTCGIQGDGTIVYDLEWDFVDDAGQPCGVTGTTPLDADPGFLDAPGDFHLQPGSPLVDAGDPGNKHEDLDGSRNDVGMYGGPRAAP